MEGVMRMTLEGPGGGDERMGNRTDVRSCEGEDVAESK